MSREGHTSWWPEYHFTRARMRNLSYLRPIVEDNRIVAYNLIMKGDDTYKVVATVTSHEELVWCMEHFNVDVYIKSVHHYVWLVDAIKSGASGILAESSGLLGVLSIKRGRYKYKLVSSTLWENNNAPIDDEFLDCLTEVYTEYGYGVHPTPASLGHAGMVQHHKLSGRKRISRPSQPLRHKLYEYGCGGRADDFGYHDVYSEVWKQDRDNNYANEMIGGVPTDKYRNIGMMNKFSLDLLPLAECATAFCQARITIQEGNEPYVSPFYIRNGSGLLEWVRRAGTYTGFWWSPMLKRCMDLGFIVEIGFCWVWDELDFLFKPWAEEAIQLRKNLVWQNKTRAAKLAKRVITGAIGHHSMKDILTMLVTDPIEGDVPFLDLEAGSYDTLVTEFYRRTIHEYNANHLTMVGYFVVMMGNVGLFDRMLEELRAGNIIISSNYDDIVVVRPPMDVPGWKVVIRHQYHQLGIRQSECLEDGVIFPGKRKVA